MDRSRSGQAFVTPGNPLADLLATDRHAQSSGGLGRLNDSYDILEALYGGMGEVLICRPSNAEVDGGIAIAFKSFQRQFYFQAEVRTAFLREIRLWSQLAGLPHIMPVIGLERVEGRLFVMMPAIPRGDDGVRTLRDLIGRDRRDPETAALICAQLAVGMALAAERLPSLVHGDLKPENLLLAGDQVFISDFGLARAAEDGHTLESTRAYRAPELAADGGHASVRSDIYAFGVMAWELLTGGHPGPDDGIPAGATGLERELFALAVSCLAQQPEDRPGSFRDIYLSLLNTAGWCRAGLTSRIMSITTIASFWAMALLPHVLEVRAKYLFQMGEYQQMLDESEKWLDMMHTANLRGLRGDALSMLGRDDEAIQAFDEVLRSGPSPRAYLGALSSKGLSLKRLGRFAEATELLQRVAAEGPEEMRPHSLMNLATISLEQKDFGTALTLLTRAAVLNPHLWQIWCNLGRAHEGAGRITQAASAFQRAVLLAPDEPAAQLSLAEVCLRLGRWDVAAAALDHLQAQGFTGRHWATTRLACLLAAGHDDQALSFMRILRDQAGETEAEEIFLEARTFLASVAAQEPAPPPEEEAPQPSFEEFAASLPAGWEAASIRPDEFPQLGGDPQVATGYSIARDGAPFLALRVYLKQHFYCYDFFCAPDNPSYVDEFLRRLAHARRGPEISSLHSQLRDIPPYFHICPSCRAHVLTNRRVGTPLRCRSCAGTARTAVVRSPQLDALVSRIADRLGTPLTDVSGFEQVLLLEADSAETAGAIGAIASRLGFEPMDTDGPAGLYLISEARTTRIPDFGNRQLVAFRKPVVSNATIFAGGVTCEIEEFVTLARAAVTVVNSISLVFDPADNSLMSLALSGRHEKMVAEVRGLVAKNPHEPWHHGLLIQLLLRTGANSEAVQRALDACRRWPRMTVMWRLLGGAHMRERRFREAIEALHRSLEIDPVQAGVLTMLARCHDELGETSLAQTFFARAHSLGGEG